MSIILKPAIYLSIISLLVYFFGVRILSAATDYAGIEDFNIFSAAAHHFIDTGRLYLGTDDMDNYGPGTPIYKFPPLYGSILSALFMAGISETSVKIFFTWLHIFCFYASAALCVISWKKPTNTTLYLITTAIILVSSPLLEWNIFFLQLDIYILFLLALSLFLLSRHYDLMAGAMIGLTVAIKIYPIALLFYLMFTRKWKVIIGIAISIVLSILFSVFVIGIDENLVFFTKILPHLLKELPSSSNPYNVSFSRLLIENGISETNAGALSTLLMIVGFIFFTAMHLKSLNKTVDQSIKIQSDILSFTGCIALMMLCMKNFWWNYQVIFVIPMVVITLSLARTRQLDWLCVIAFVIALALLDISTLTQLIRNDWGDYGLYARSLGPVIMLGILVRLRWKFDSNQSTSLVVLSPPAIIVVTGLVFIAVIVSAILAYEMDSLHQAWQPFRR